MRLRQITRYNPATGRVERPWRSRNHHFVLAQPAPGAELPDTAALREVDNYGEALELVEQGFAIRMSDGKALPTLVVPSALEISEAPHGRIDGLWTYTMPPPPFAKAALDDGIRHALMLHAATVRVFAGRDAARRFVDLDGPNDDVAAGRIDLDRFNLTRLVHAAYDSAFRTGSDRPLDDEEIAQLEEVIGLLLTCERRSVRDSVRDKLQPLRHTVRCAWLRWKIARGELADCDWGGTITENLAALAGMSHAALRNGLAREGISTIKDRLCDEAIVRWLEGRRNFVPLREAENPRMRATQLALAKLASAALPQALTAISQRSIGFVTDRAQLCRAETQILAAAHSGAVPADMLRGYARSLRLCIDSFVLGFDQALADARRQGLPMAPAGQLRAVG